VHRACADAEAVAQGPSDQNPERWEDLLAKMPRSSNTFTTSTHYSLWRPRVIDAAVEALAADAP
jgi:hypothetical protein